MSEISDIVAGANAGRSRSHNRQVVLGRLRAAGSTGRAEIARATGLSTQAISNIIADLLEDGLITEQGRRAVGRGLPAVQYGLNPAGGYALGVEIRPDAVFAALLDLCGTPLASGRTPLQAADRSHVTETVLELRHRVVADSGADPARLLGAGIVMPGPFGQTGLRGSRSDLAIWDEPPPGEWLSDVLDLPVLIENDANAAAIAERISGVAQGLDTYAFLYFGNGLGLGVVSGGQLMQGAFGNAGEIGHIPVPAAGKTERLERVVSRMALQSALGARPISGVDALDRLYHEKDAALLGWLDSAVEPLSAAVAIVENLFDPQAVILGGAMPDSILDHLLAHCVLAERSVSNRQDRSGPRLLRGASGRMTATLGAAALVLNHAFTPKISVNP